jgi:hypothetical protein
MRTINKLVFFLLHNLFAAALRQSSYRKTKGGMPYQLYKGKAQNQFCREIL